MQPELRPRVKIISQLEKEEVIKVIKNKIEDPNSTFSGWAKDDYALICAPVNEKHIWTPQLNLQIEKTEDGTEIRGVIGPSANVWTAFAFTFSILGFISFVSLFWGLSRLSLDYSADILWAVPITLALIFGVYILAKVGKRLSKNEVLQLKDFIETALNE